ncbi:exodeoxyribonuclease VII large subunit [Candidatus Omnitrophota bacterium]
MKSSYDFDDAVTHDTKTIYKVSELTQLVKDSLENEFSGIWVEGEVSNFAAPLSGHCYLTLKDTTAQLRVVIFKYVNQRLRFKIENGMKILCFGKITVYPQRGEYQLVVTKVEPKGVGALQLAFEQLKKKLAKEGLFDHESKKEIPLLPQRIGVVTSMTGAAFRDIVHVLNRRFSNIQVTLVPVQVQGERAAEAIARAIDLLNEYNKVDVIIVGRGGGSIEDLWAFNEEIVARAIFNSTVPIISAVGHEIDYTISDFVADLRAPTPSAAAEVVIGRKEYMQEKIDILLNSLQQLTEAKLERARQKIETLKGSYFFRNPRAIIENYSITIDNLFQTLLSSTKSQFRERQLNFEAICQKLAALNPLAVLGRGYGVTFTEDGLIVKSIKDVAQKQNIMTKVFDGIIHSTVIKTAQEK